MHVLSYMLLESYETLQFFHLTTDGEKGSTIYIQSLIE